MWGTAVSHVVVQASLLSRLIIKRFLFFPEDIWAENVSWAWRCWVCSRGFFLGWQPVSPRWCETCFTVDSFQFVARVSLGGSRALPELVYLSLHGSDEIQCYSHLWWIVCKRLTSTVNMPVCDCRTHCGLWSNQFAPVVNSSGNPVQTDVQDVSLICLSCLSTALIYKQLKM